MIVVTGATGSIGRALIERLDGEGEEVLAVLRRPADLGCEYVLGDFDRPETVGEALSAGDRLFLNTSPWPGFVRGHRAVIDLAREAGVAQVVSVSVRGAAPGAPLAGGMHGEVDDHLRASGVPWSILRPVGFMQNLLTDVRDGRIYGSYGQGRVGYIDTRDIADVAAALLTRPVGPDGTYVLTGPDAPTQDEIAAAVSGALGREVRYVDLPVPEMAAHLAGQGIPEPFARDLARLMADTGDGRWSTTTSTVEDVTGHRPRSLAAFLADHAATWPA
ncbi:SDR family oxidoreductase [Sphaerisporangium perillae]|uniref:SDR family oxidoreductase n=1 Tax=Sphaerisporangium perillae TaxID=2935860 RepID=UPI00200E0B89|nr:SDR family oxidoreductase [Sphaerisporangium perillae]